VIQTQTPPEVVIPPDPDPVVPPPLPPPTVREPLPVPPVIPFEEPEDDLPPDDTEEIVVPPEEPAREEMKTCTCDHGTGSVVPVDSLLCYEGGSDVCTVCDDNYHVDSHACKPNECVCAHGTAADTTSEPACHTHEDNICVSCAGKYELHDYDDTCVAIEDDVVVEDDTPPPPDDEPPIKPPVVVAPPEPPKAPPVPPPKPPTFVPGQCLQLLPVGGITRETKDLTTGLSSTVKNTRKEWVKVECDDVYFKAAQKNPLKQDEVYPSPKLKTSPKELLGTS